MRPLSLTAVLLVAALAGPIDGAGESGAAGGQTAMLFEPLWGEAYPEAGGVELIAPRHTEGAALAVAPWSGEPVKLEVLQLERWGGPERWRGFWLLLLCRDDRVHPAFYVRPMVRGLEWGWSHGPQHQSVSGTVVVSARGRDPLREPIVLWAAQRRGVLHVTLEEVATISLTGVPAFRRLGLYCESSRVQIAGVGVKDVDSSS